MTPTAIALLGFVSWALILLMSIETERALAMLTAGRAPNSFGPSGDDMPGFGKRLIRAHANCYEFLPLAGVVMLYAIATGQTAATDGLAYAFIAARIAQSLTHITSTSSIFAIIRFGFFGVQLVVLVIWLLKLFPIT
jgi:uncharacterized MAPEG superfamily protein